jgi:hypothetical protein
VHSLLCQFRTQQSLVGRQLYINTFFGTCRTNNKHCKLGIHSDLVPLGGIDCLRQFRPQWGVVCRRGSLNRFGKPYSQLITCSHKSALNKQDLLKPSYRAYFCLKLLIMTNLSQNKPDKLVSGFKNIWIFLMTGTSFYKHQQEVCSFTDAHPAALGSRVSSLHISTQDQ